MENVHFSQLQWLYLGTVNNLKIWVVLKLGSVKNNFLRAPWLLK